jgi:hypothetical protein
MERMQKETAISYSCVKGVTTQKKIESQVSMPRLVLRPPGKQNDNSVTAFRLYRVMLHRKRWYEDHE